MAELGKGQLYISSSSFYSSPKGYKMRCRVSYYLLEYFRFSSIASNFLSSKCAKDSSIQQIFYYR